MRAALAQASLVRHRGRTALGILGVAGAAAMLLDMVMLATGMRQSFKELLLTRGFQLRLSPKGTLPFDTDATIPDVAGVTATLRRNPDIGEISPVLGGSIHMPIGDRDVSASVLGIDPSVQGDYELLSGRDVRDASSIVVNDRLLRALGKRIADTISVATGYDPQTRSYAGQRDFVIT